MARNHTFTFHASDNVFTTASLSGQYRAYPSGTTPSAWQPIGEGGAFALPDSAADGQWTVDYRAADPCNSFAAADATSADIDATTLVTLDTTAPGIVIADPDQGAVYKRFSKHPSDYACSDASSGVATCVGPVADNANFDTGSVGPKTFTVNATDQLGNPSSQTIAYTIDADMAVDGIVGIRSMCGGPGCLKLGVEIRSQRYGVPGATVTITVKRPDGSIATLTGLTDRNGAVGWTFPLIGPGSYVVTVTNVSAPYYNYIPANNAITTRTYTIANR